MPKKKDPSLGARERVPQYVLGPAFSYPESAFYLLWKQVLTLVQQYATPGRHPALPARRGKSPSSRPPRLRAVVDCFGCGLCPEFLLRKFANGMRGHLHCSGSHMLSHPCVNTSVT